MADGLEYDFKLRWAQKTGVSFAVGHAVTEGYAFNLTALGGPADGADRTAKAQASPKFSGVWMRGR
jgi:hypothetical protein